MKKKLLIVVTTLILIVAVPIVIAQITQATQDIHVSGTANYPRNAPPTPTPSADPATVATLASTVKFSLRFPNGTSCPTTLTNLPTNVYGPLDSVGNPVTTEIVVHNDGNVPINITITALNVNVPSNILFKLGSDVEHNPIGVGQTANVYIAINMVTTNSNFFAHQPFSYSFDISVIASQA